jgi:phosphate-selective porin
MKYYKTNSNSAFASYFYYFHFVELLQKLTDDELSIILTNTDVEKDYNDFNDNRKKTCNINDKIFARSIVAVLSFILIVYFSYMVYYNFGFTRNVIS